MKKKKPQKHDVKPPYSEWEKICESEKKEKLMKTLERVIPMFFFLAALAVGIVCIFTNSVVLLYVTFALGIIGLVFYFFLPFFFLKR